MSIFDAPQRSEAWYKERLGKPTASNFRKIISASGKKSASAEDYLWQLLAERIFGVSFQRDISGYTAVKWGIEHEDQAKEELEAFKQVKITPATFVLDKTGRYGASPDGYLFDNEPVEIKCPQPPQQLENLLTPPDEYWPQLMGQMLVTGATRAHFWSWSPFTPSAYVALDRDQKFCQLLEKELGAFCDRLDEYEAKAKAFGSFDAEGYREAKAKGRL